MTEGILFEYGKFLPIDRTTPRIGMGEGNTPLLRSRHIVKLVGCSELYFKLEGCNPTGSFKDRGMVMAVAKTLEIGSKGILCASTGNTSASAAAYGAYFGLETVVLVSKSAIAQGKLAQALAHGAHVIVINDVFDRVLQLARSVTERHPLTLVNSVNPYRLEGQKTAAFEIVDSLGDSPDYLCIPVGNAGNITAYWKGFCQYKNHGNASRLPKMMGFQAEGASPIVLGRPVSNPTTVASAIRIGNPASWTGATSARDESKGSINAVTDEEILEAQRLLAQREGVFCEPASAASLGGLIKLARQGLHLKNKKVVCIITGTGLKDPQQIESYGGTSLKETSGDLDSVEALLPVIEPPKAKE